MKYMCLSAMALALAGCATLIDGTKQPVALTTNAEGATCSIVQNGVEIVPPSPVPGTFVLARRKGHLHVTCAAPGYEPSTKILVTGKNPLSVAGHMWNSMLLAAVDVATGSVNEYQGSAYMHLRKQAGS